MNIKNRYVTKEYLGEPVKVKLAQGACISTNESGESEAYFVMNGPPATFYCVNVEDGKVKFSLDLPQSDVVWAITAGCDRNIYFSGTNDSVFYRYIPKERKVEELGLNPSDKWVWDLRGSSDGMIYGCTYPGCKVFSYDINARVFKDFGNVSEGEQYARGISVTDNYIYVGVGAHKHLVRIDTVTGEKQEIKLTVTGEDGFVYSLWAVNNKLFLQINGSEWIIMDETTNEIIGRLPSAGTISPHSPKNPDIVYFVSADQLYTYNCKLNHTTLVGKTENMSGVKRFGWVTLKNNQGEARTILAAATASTNIVLYDPEDNCYKTVSAEVLPKPVAIQSLEAGTGNKLYLGGYQRGMCIYDTAENLIEESVGLFPQPEGIGFLNGKVYFGTYPGAKIYSYDPQKDIQFNNSHPVNPYLEYIVESGQDRPFAMTSGDNKLFVGTTAYYGKLQGALTIYDQETNKWKVYEKVVKNQSIIGLTYRDGMLYGSTSIWGGLGIEPVEASAKIFVWDVTAEKKLTEFTPEIPGIDTAPVKIGELSFGPDGLLWGAISGVISGATSGAIFALAVDTFKVVKYKVVYQKVSGFSRWRPVFLRWGKDNLLYTTLGNNLTVINPTTLEYEILAEGGIGLMTLGEDSSIYYAVGTELIKLSE